jgi:hypothetical protein
VNSSCKTCFTTVTHALRQNIILPVTELWTWLQAGDGLLQLKRWAESYLEDILHLRVLRTPRCCSSQRLCCKKPRHCIKPPVLHLTEQQCNQSGSCILLVNILYRQLFKSYITIEVSTLQHLEAPPLPGGLCSPINDPARVCRRWNDKFNVASLHLKTMSDKLNILHRQDICRKFVTYYWQYEPLAFESF